MKSFPDSLGQELGEEVLTRALALAREGWGERLVAAYALGSLAHGGFSAHVSDVDVAFILADPIESADAQTVEALASAVKETRVPLAERLSVFWGSAATLSGAQTGGRFPPVDRLDLIESGRLLAGLDVRAQILAPSPREMLVAAAAQALRSLATPEASDQLRNPEALVAAGVRPLTKKILFPVRFLFTARTGRIGRNDAAVEFFAAAEPGPAAELALKGFEWRYEPPRSGDPAVLECVQAGLLPLYRIFVDDYEARLRPWGEAALARSFADWRARLLKI
ncbi:MAG: hypothetical protein HYY28_09705 [Betaproteobacteria bacterium]|nr:hypothetical protein [Betaproteobacteria bacterium]MBI2960577.1 hypothetical protein [Betaproteobacteria bacterium]